MDLQRIEKQKSHDTRRCFNGISQDFFLELVTGVEPATH